jgi:predicted  nucleic acid-binding Zn-ribbon protein
VLPSPREPVHHRRDDVTDVAHSSAPRTDTPTRHDGSPPAATAGREKRADEIAALVRLAELDAAIVHRDARKRPPAGEEVAKERRGLATKLSSDLLEAYERALRAGRKPPVVTLVESVCRGCHVRLHAKLDHQVRQRRGAAPCPHCLRVVYDPAWLTK